MQPVTALTGFASHKKTPGRGRGKPAALTDAQQIQQVMTKLGFGSKPGEAEFVGQMEFRRTSTSSYSLGRSTMRS